MDEGDPEPEPKIVQTKHGTHQIQARRITWRCEWCSEEYTEWRFPGPKPRYCETSRQYDPHTGRLRHCRQEARAAQAAGAMARKRAADHTPKRPVGRPRTR